MLSQISDQLSLLCWPPLQITNAEEWILHAVILVQILCLSVLIWQLTSQAQCPDGIYSVFGNHAQTNGYPYPLTDSLSLLLYFCIDWINGLTWKEVSSFPVIAGMCPISLKILALISLVMWLWGFGDIHPTGQLNFTAESMPRIT